jgi:hypothetical protein
MRSPLEVLDGRFRHVLLTTFSFNLRFFERWVLHALWASEARNVVVFVDREQLGRALEDRAPAAAGKSYHLIGSDRAASAFHPKLLLAVGEDHARLCVSSANLTADGQMRNVEIAMAFDSHLDGHRRPIHDAGELFRRLAIDAPAHTAAAIQKALAALPDPGEETSPFRLVHNLDRPLIDEFPPAGRAVAISPFVDASGEAAARLHALGGLTVHVDGDHIAAPASFFAGPWTVRPAHFEAGRLHGKAYDVDTGDGRWILVGSPNLSAAGLLHAAPSGNAEVAVALRVDAPLELPPSAPWDGDRLDTRAEARLRAKGAEEAATPATSFEAWEDEVLIRVSGVPDGTAVERWAEERWQPLGTVADQAVAVSDPEIRPARLRAVLANGRTAYAVVAQPSRLRATVRARTSGRQTEAAERLPLDVATVRVLEQALGDLYALSELAGERPRPGPPQPGAGGDAEPNAPAGGLVDWMPRNPDDEPRIPPLYTDAWAGEPDALLALIGRVLRLDRDEGAGEAVVGREDIDLDELESITSEQELEPDDPEPEPVRTTRPELDRYRRAFLRLFERGKRFVGETGDATLAAWAFTYLLRLVEELGTHHVEVEDVEEPLLPLVDRLRVALRLLELYLGREEGDPLCLHSARFHLALCRRERRRFSRLERERIERLAFRWAGDLVAAPRDLPGPPDDALGLDALSANAWLEPYAERSDWDTIEREVRRQLAGAAVVLDPFPSVVGSAAFATRTDSPAWWLIAFAAPAGQATPDPFAVIVRNADASSHVVVHALACAPERGLLVEAVLRRRDRRWLTYSYNCRDRVTLEVAGRIGPGELDRRGYAELEALADAEPPLPLIAALCEAPSLS